MKNNLEKLVKKYETNDFIKDDPIQFPHRFKNQADIEISAFIASLFAYGSRKVFIKKLNELFEIMNNQPLNFVLNFNPKSLRGFNYRFAKDVDIIEVFLILKKLYGENKSLKELFEYGYKIDGTITSMLQCVCDYFYSNISNKIGAGFYHLIPNPKNGGAMKRMNMFLRWLIRNGEVDFGIWNFIDKKDLLIPLDVHVARISREMGLLNFKSNDFKSVIQLTENLKKLDKNDPIKYDFAMFGMGIDKDE
jgi:uncharacterized protein (TIGR02757 family)